MATNWIGAVAASLLFTTSPALAQTVGSGLPPTIASAGVTQDQWDAIRREVRFQAQRTNVSEAALLAAAEASGANFARSGRFDAMSLQQAIFEALATQADQIAELERRLDDLTDDADPSIASLFVQARTALIQGSLADADRLLSVIAERDLEAIRQADAEVERRRLRAGETIAARGQVASLQADYRSAAAHFARAAETVPDRATPARWRYSHSQAYSLYNQGERFPGGGDLEEAHRLYEQVVLPLAPRTERPSDWASTQESLGIVLSILAERQVGTEQRASFSAARLAYERALEVRTRAADPQSWAQTQTNLGALLTRLGEHQLGAEGLATLTAARASYERALEVRTRSADPAGWATTQMNLGVLLRAIGGRQAGPEGFSNIMAARAAYERALEVYTRATHPQDWAVAQVSLGNVLETLGERQSGMAALGDLASARAAYERALEVRTRNTDPQGWARTQMSLGNVLSILGERQNGAEGLSNLAAARASYDRALEVRTRLADPQGWAMTQANIGVLEIAIGDRTHDRSAYQRAAMRFRAALEVWRRGQYRARAELDLARAEQLATAR